MIVVIVFIEKLLTIPLKIGTFLQTHHVYSTLKRRRNDRFHVAWTWNTRGVFVGADY